MKLFAFLTTVFLVSALNCAAQIPAPGRSLAVAYSEPSDDGTNITLPPQNSQSSSAIAEYITPEIQDMANGLKNDPTRIFNFVHDHIDHVLYFGSKKGAALTLLERSGNDFDQCALLSALLQASGYTNVGYQFGWMTIPYDSPNHLDLHHWLKLNFTNNQAQWSNTVNFFSYLLGSRGFFRFHDSGNSNSLAIEHVWVTLTTGGTNYILDPSIKDYEPVTGINLATAMQLNTNTFISGAGGTTNGYYSVQGISEPSIRSSLQQYTSNYLAYLSNNAPTLSVAQVIGGYTMVSSVGTPLLTTNLFPLYTTNNTWPVLTWTYQPTTYMSSVNLNVVGTNIFFYMPRLQGQRISLTFDTNGTAGVWLDDSNLLTTATSATTNRVNVVLSVNHPYGPWDPVNQVQTDGGTNYSFDEIVTNSYQRTNASYAIIYAFETSPRSLQKRQQMLDAYRQQGYPNSSRQVVTETLNVMGLNWILQQELSDNLICQLSQQLPQWHHIFGRMAQETGSGYYVDVYDVLDGKFSSTGISDASTIVKNQAFDLGAYFSSAMEYGVMQQLESTNTPAASTVKMLEIANTNSQTIYMAYNGVWNTGPNISNNLVNYDSGTLSAINSAIANGDIILLPQNGGNPVSSASGAWKGYGYFDYYLSGTSINSFHSYTAKISGGYNGGYSGSKTGQADPDAVADNDEEQPDNDDPESAASPTSGGTVAEPVRNADAVFEMDTSDLSIGQAEPKGIHFGRHYESSARYYNNAGMANGWVHNYFINANIVSAPQPGLGTTTPQQMAPMLVASFVALNIYNDTVPVPKNWMTTTLISKWGIDQLINNAVSITLGKDTIQFIKQPDGSFTPPASSTMTLTNNGSGLNLTMRHGNTFRFAVGGLLTNIVEQYTNAMNLSYNASNWVSTVTDWKGRSLTFNYAGTPSHLTWISDSSGRSNVFGYTANANMQLDLTSFTDAENKTSSYFYDTNHQIIATANAVGQMVVSNVYDGFGRVITQYTDGDTNKTWQIYWSGFNTVVVDPAGGQQEFIFDNQSRQIGMKDANGNYSQTFYDGEDHVVTNISALNETNIFIYDANNNLLETIDPLGKTNGFVYDTQFNLRTNIDSFGHVKSFGYNSKFQLIGSTNAMGDWVANSYDPNTGLLLARTDLSGTTTFGYDIYGQLSNVIYPGGLGTNTLINNVLGDAVTNINPRGFKTVYQYNLRRQPTMRTATNNFSTSIVYDAVGNVVTNIDAMGNSTSYIWSPTRHLLSTTYPLPLPGGTNSVITNVYDARDWQTNTLDPLNRPTTKIFDLAGRLLNVSDPLSRTNYFGYDNDNRQTSSTNALMQTTFQSYDSRGELTNLTDQASKSVLKTYDANGNQTLLVNRNGQPWQFNFDAANRLTNTMTPMGRSNYQAWNHLGLLQTNKDFMGQLTTNGYDGCKRLTNRTDSLATTTYRYDFNGNLTNVIENGKSNWWSFDPYDRPIGYTDSASNLIQYGYDTNGNLTTLVYPGKGAVTYAYDGLNRLITVTDWSNRVTGYTYDLDARVTSVTRPNGTVRTINYDFAGQTTNIIEQTALHAPIAFFLLKWDKAGLVQSEFMAPTNAPYTPPTRTLQYDADNRLTNFNTTAIVNDNNGNMTSGPLLTNSSFATYVYDARNRLTSAGGITYGYDALNNRVSETNGTNVTLFVIDPNSSQTLIRTKNGVTNYYVYGLGLLYEEDDTATSTTILTYHFDYRGSTIALTDTNGIITDQIQYSAYGMTTLHKGTNDTPFQYNGRYGVQTDTNGLLCMRARYYNPYICRFINPDPSGWQGGLNFYAYANGDPIRMSDPFGLAAVGENTGKSWVGNVLRSIPLVGGVLGGVGDFVTGVANTTIGLVSFGYSGTLIAGLNEVGHGFGSTVIGSVDLVGKAWASPTTAIGLIAGTANFFAGVVSGTHPAFAFDHNAIEFLNLPWGTGGALTLGNTSEYNASDPNSTGARYDNGPGSVTFGPHEEAHTYQAEVLGPFFLPVYFALGGISAHNPLENSADNYAQHVGSWLP